MYSSYALRDCFLTALILLAGENNSSNQTLLLLRWLPAAK